MNGTDWRAQLRSQDIPRRAPPSDRAGRPDRGYVEQPEERLEPSVLRRKGLIPMSELERVQLEELAEELGEPSPFEEPKPASLPVQALQPQPETQPSEPPAAESGSTEMPRGIPKKKRRTPVFVAQSIKNEVMTLALQAKRGDIPRLSKQYGVPEGTIASWLYTHRKNHGNAPPTSTSTLVSAPMSGPVSAAGPLPPAPTVMLSGLDEYVRALVAIEFKAQMRKAFGGE